MIELNAWEFKTIKEELRSIIDVCESLRKDVEKNRASISEIPKKKEFYQLKKDAQKALNAVRNERGVYEKRNTALEGAVDGVAKRTKDLERRIGTVSQTIGELSKMSDEMMSHTKDVRKMLERQNSVFKKMDSLESGVSENTKKIDAIVAVVERIVDLNKKTRGDKNV